MVLFSCQPILLNWKMASLIAEGHELGKAAPVVYVSGEEVSIFLSLVLANQHACFKASLMLDFPTISFLSSISFYLLVSRPINGS